MLYRRTLRVAAVALPLLAACVTQDDNQVQVRRQRLEAAKVAGLAGIARQQKPPRLPPERFLTMIGGRPMLPAYKTKWEREMERRLGAAKSGAGGGLVNADTYDDYRNNNFDRFFITKPPTSTAFRAPAEYEVSQAYVLSPDQTTQSAWIKMYGEIIQGAWGKVPVLMVYRHASHKAWIESQLTALGYSAAAIQDPKNIIWWQHETDGIWVRDYGPISIVSTPVTGQGALSFVDVRYYHFRVYDDVVPTDLAKDWGVNVFRPDLDMEGGNFMNTDDGLCAMTKGVQTYNPQLSQSAIEDIFKDYVGCKKFLWPAPMTGVIEHIDMFAKFGPGAKALVAEYTQTQDAANKAILDANAQLFGQATTPTGAAVTVTRIPMPNQGGTSTSPVYRTYTNSTALAGATDKVILIPVYAGDTTYEAQAMTAYSAVFPGWTQVKVTSDVIIPGEGATHCITMQIPAGTKAKMEADPADLCGPKKIACVVATCGNVTAEGCCDGEVLRYCENGKLVAADCTGSPSCGWDGSNGWYDCGTSGGADPSGTYVKSCNVVTDAPAPDLGPDILPAGCGNVGYEGCCDGDTVWFCENSQLSSINCALSGALCSWDSANGYYDCGSSGAADPSGVYPQSCGTVMGDAGSLPPSDGQTPPDQGAGCGSITYEGCCDGDVLKFCQNNQVETLDCSQQPSCGWESQGNYYDCGTSGGADPSGSHPKACGGTSPDARPSQDLFTADTAPTQPDQSASVTDQSVVDGAVSGDGAGKGGGGCSCRVGGASDSGPPNLVLFGLMAGLALTWRRRRR